MENDFKVNGYFYEPRMSPEEFEEANTDEFQQNRVEDNPHFAYMVNN